MKNVLLITILMATSFVAAQDRKTTFGINVGYSSSWTSANIDSRAPLFNHYDPIGSLVIGAVINYKFNDFLSLQGEVQYSKKGLSLTADYNNDGAVTAYYKNRQYTFSYLGLPVLGKLNFTKSKMPFVLLGLSPNFNLSSKYNYDIVGVSPVYTSTQEGDINDYNTFDMPLTLGVGVERPIGKTFIDLNIRYNIGLIETFDSHKISSFNILAGFRF